MVPPGRACVKPPVDCRRRKEISHVESTAYENERKNRRRLRQNECHWGGGGATMSLSNVKISLLSLVPERARKEFARTWLSSLLGQAVVMLVLIIGYVALLVSLYKLIPDTLNGLRSVVDSRVYYGFAVAPLGIILVFSTLPTAFRAWRQYRLSRRKFAWRAGVSELFRLHPYGADDQAEYERPEVGNVRSQNPPGRVGRRRMDTSVGRRRERDALTHPTGKAPGRIPAHLPQTARHRAARKAAARTTHHRQSSGGERPTRLSPPAGPAHRRSIRLRSHPAPGRMARARETLPGIRDEGGRGTGEDRERTQATPQRGQPDERPVADGRLRDLVDERRGSGQRRTVPDRTPQRAKRRGDTNDDRGHGGDPLQTLCERRTERTMGSA